MTNWTRITAAVGVALGGDRERGRHDLLACWELTGEQEHAPRCVLAHYLADLQDVVDDEVAWDERALAAYAHIGETELVPLGIASAGGLAPSLHLNLGDGYLRQGRVIEARAQLEAGLAAVGALGDDGYATMIRGGLDRLAVRMAQADPDAIN